MNQDESSLAKMLKWCMAKSKLQVSTFRDWGGSKGERLRGSRILEALRTWSDLQVAWLRSGFAYQVWCPGLRELGVILGSRRVWELRRECYLCWDIGSVVACPFRWRLGALLLKKRTLFSLDRQCSLEDNLQFLNDIKAFQTMSKN